MHSGSSERTRGGRILPRYVIGIELSEHVPSRVFDKETDRTAHTRGRANDCGGQEEGMGAEGSDQEQAGGLRNANE